MRTIFTFTILIAITCLSGMVHGTLSRRWGVPESSDRAAEQLGNFPTQIGPWRMLGEKSELEDSVKQTLESAGSVVATYQHDESGDVVRMAVILGPPGPISVHTPEICYSSRDYNVNVPRKVAKVKSLSGKNSGEFWALTFQSRKVERAMLRVYYAWSDGSVWKAESNPRLSFARSPYLYKIQLASFVSSNTNLKTQDPVRDFLSALLDQTGDSFVPPSE